MENDTNLILPSRRRFLKAAVGGAVVLHCAQPSHAFIFAFMGRIFMYGVRVISGLIFDDYVAVAVVPRIGSGAIKKGAGFVAKAAAEAVVAYGVEKGLEETFSFTDDKTAEEFAYYPTLESIPFEQNFDHQAYKKAVIHVHPVRIGMSDEEYRAYREQEEKIILSRTEDEDRFEMIAKYITDNRGKVLHPNENITRKITADSQPSDYFLGDLIFPDGRETEHYRRMIELTGVTVFNELTA